jgi:hypothetical protein
MGNYSLWGIIRLAYMELTPAQQKASNVKDHNEKERAVSNSCHRKYGAKEHFEYE